MKINSPKIGPLASAVFLGLLITIGSTENSEARSVFQRSANKNQVEKVLTCAKEMSKITTLHDYLGQVFIEDDMLFVSSDRDFMSDSQAIRRNVLFVLSNSGYYSYLLPEKTVSKVRFVVPVRSQYNNYKMYYMRYLHSLLMSNRYYDFSIGVPPEGYKSEQFSTLSKVKIDTVDVQTEIIFQLQDKLDTIMSAVKKGKLERYELKRADLTVCRNLPLSKRQIVQSFNRRIDDLNILSIEKKKTTRRLPASIN